MLRPSGRVAWHARAGRLAKEGRPLPGHLGAAGGIGGNLAVQMASSRGGAEEVIAPPARLPRAKARFLAGLGGWTSHRPQ